MSFTRVIDDELELELLHVGLAEEIFREVNGNREHLRAWLPWVDDTRQLLDTREFLRASMAGWAEGRLVRCAIRWCAPGGTSADAKGRVCGSVSLERIDRNLGCAEVGYWLAEDCQGRGIMTRAVAAIMELAFEDDDLFRLDLLAAVGNTRSWAIPERLGWTFEGVRRQSHPRNGVRLDMRAYSWLRTDVDHATPRKFGA